MSEPSSHRISSRTRSGHFTRTRTAPTVAPEAPGVEAEVVAMVDRMKGIYFYTDVCDVSLADMFYCNLYICYTTYVIVILLISYLNTLHERLSTYYLVG